MCARPGCLAAAGCLSAAGGMGGNSRCQPSAIRRRTEPVRASLADTSGAPRNRDVGSWVHVHVSRRQGMCQLNGQESSEHRSARVSGAWASGALGTAGAWVSPLAPRLVGTQHAFWNRSSSSILRHRSMHRCSYTHKAYRAQKQGARSQCGTLSISSRNATFTPLIPPGLQGPSD